MYGKGDQPNPATQQFWPSWIASCELLLSFWPTYYQSKIDGGKPRLQGVGKSFLLLRFFHGSYTTRSITTIGFCDIWVTAGHECFGTITIESLRVQASYRGQWALLLVYDVTDRLSSWS
ncbi:Uncharacterized protein Rs2_02612 [Raphanus sativus]|nr:Uncharacterized protein Rs2_02612 [Raphanus sativus]